MPHRDLLRPDVFMAQVAGGWQFPSAVMQYSLPELHRLSIDLAALERKRDFLVAELQGSGYDLQTPQGTFYLWARSPDPDDLAFARRLADRGVLVLPGSTCAAPGHFRITLTSSTETIEHSLHAFHSVLA